MTAEIWAKGKGGRATLPYAFTEQRIYMLMTVLKGDLATKQMKDYIVENKEIFSTNETIKLTNLVNEHSNKIADIENKLEIVMVKGLRGHKLLPLNYGLMVKAEEHIHHMPSLNKASICL